MSRDNGHLTEQRVYVEPTDEQLANFMCVRNYGPGYDPVFKRAAFAVLALPSVRAIWVGHHRAFQERAWAMADAIGGPGA